MNHHLITKRQNERESLDVAFLSKKEKRMLMLVYFEVYVNVYFIMVDVQ